MIHENKKDEASQDDAATVKVEDLPLEKNEGEAVKGGPAYMKLGDIKGEATFHPGRG